MKNYIRVCVSLDQETIDYLKVCKNFSNLSKSEIVKRCVKRYCKLYLPAEFTKDIREKYNV